MAIVPDDELTDRNVGALHEIAARRGPLVVITHEGVDLGEVDCVRIDVPRNERELDPVLLVVPLQLLAFHAATQLGHDIDKPRNLAKSVTVRVRHGVRLRTLSRVATPPKRRRPRVTEPTAMTKVAPVLESTTVDG